METADCDDIVVWSIYTTLCNIESDIFEDGVISCPKRNNSDCLKGRKLIRLLESGDLGGPKM